MKKNKCELIAVGLKFALEFFKLLFKHLDLHRIQARIIWTFSGLYAILKACANEIVLIINALK